MYAKVSLNMPCCPIFSCLFLLIETYWPRTRKCACPPGYGGEHCEFQQTLKNGYRNDGQSGAWLIVGCLFIVLGVMVAVALKSKPKAGDSIEPSFGSLGVEGITNPNEKKDENEWSSGSMQCFGSSFI